MRAFLIVLDSVGIGEAPDAAAYGDAGANTLAHCASAAGGLDMPMLQSLGLGNIPPVLPQGLPIRGVPAATAPLASFGAMQEQSKGKDTTTGHWEMAGLLLDKGFQQFPEGPPSFPAPLISAFAERTGRGVLANRAASGTKIIEELGHEQMQTGQWIVYTSADSVFQVAAHEDVISLEELYSACRVARELCNPYRIGRVIARPYTGSPGNFTRTDNRRDFSYPLPEPTILDKLQHAGVRVTTAGKLDDVFAGKGITHALHSETNADAVRDVLEQAREEDKRPGLVFANLIDFDMRYGHRRDAYGYAKALEKADAFLGSLVKLLLPYDLLIVTADHGNDPTFKGTDHTREYVPLLVYRPGRPGRCLEIRQGFFDVAQTLADFFGAPAMPRGRSCLENR